MTKAPPLFLHALKVTDFRRIVALDLTFAPEGGLVMLHAVTGTWQVGGWGQATGLLPRVTVADLWAPLVSGPGKMKAIEKAIHDIEDATADWEKQTEAVAAVPRGLVETGGAMLVDDHALFRTGVRSEIADRVEVTVLAMRPRITRLKALGLVELTGEKRPNVSKVKADVVRLTKRADAAVNQAPADHAAALGLDPAAVEAGIKLAGPVAQSAAVGRINDSIIAGQALAAHEVHRVHDAAVKVGLHRVHAQQRVEIELRGSAPGGRQGGGALQL